PFRAQVGSEKPVAHLPPLVAPDSSGVETQPQLQPYLSARSMPGYGELSSPLGTKLQDAINERRRGGRHVERLDPPPHRQRDQLVTGLRDPWPQAAALGSEHQNDLPPVVRPLVGHAVGRGAINPGAGLLRLG